MTTREEYLGKLMVALAPLLEEHLTGATAVMDTWRVSCGWPLGRSKRGNRGAIGQCFSDTVSKDGRTEMFVSPQLETVADSEDMAGVGSVLLHEMCHAALGVQEGHGKAFQRLARAVGLVGPIRATRAGDALNARLRAIEKELGPYPHAAITLGNDPAHKPQTTRLLKASCPTCSYTIRVTQKWVDTGLPTCQCGTMFKLERK